MILDIISSTLGFVGPPIFDFIKKKFLKPTQDSAEATIGTLAVTKPEMLDKFVLANASLLESKVKYFNRDVVGQPSQWVIDLRASIRPTFTIISLLLIFLSTAYNWDLNPSITALIEITTTSWFGSRLVK